MTCSSDKTSIIWDSGTGKILFVLVGHEDIVSSVAITSDNEKVVSGSADFTTIIWDVKTGTNL